jgi:hypothetical protein
MTGVGQGGVEKMFEVIFGVVCLGVLIVEVIEVRQKCKEPYPRIWHGVSIFQPHPASPTGVCETGVRI